MNRQYKRRKYFINKEFQGRYIFNYFLLATIGSILFIGVFSFFSSNTLSIVYDNYHLQLGVTPDILFKNILSTQWVFIVLGGGFVAIITLFLSHRVAGPFYRFEKTFDAMAGGDLSAKVILRKKDEGKNLALKINAFNSSLSEQLSLIKTLNSKIEISAHQLKKILKDADMDISKAEPFLDQILESQKNVHTMINDYTFSRDRL